MALTGGQVWANRQPPSTLLGHMTNSSAEALRQVNLDQNLAGARLHGQTLDTLDPITGEAVRRTFEKMDPPEASTHMPFQLRHHQERVQQAHLREQYASRRNQVSFDFNRELKSDPVNYAKPQPHYPAQQAQQFTQMARQACEEARSYGTSHANIFDNYAPSGDIYRRKSLTLGRDEYFRPGSPRTEAALRQRQQQLAQQRTVPQQPALYNNRRHIHDNNATTNVVIERSQTAERERFSRDNLPHLIEPNSPTQALRSPSGQQQTYLGANMQGGYRPPVAGGNQPKAYAGQTHYEKMEFAGVKNVRDGNQAYGNPNQAYGKPAQGYVSPSKQSQGYGSPTKQTSVFASAAMNRQKKRHIKATQVGQEPDRLIRPRPARAPPPAKVDGQWMRTNNIFGAPADVPVQRDTNNITNQDRGALQDYRQQVYANQQQYRRVGNQFPTE